MKNKLLNIVKAAGRGVIKSIPGGNVAIEVVNSIKGEKKHNYWSIITQALCVGAIVYAFATKLITLDDLLRLLGFGG